MELQLPEFSHYVDRNKIQGPQHGLIVRVVEVEGKSSSN